MLGKVTSSFRSVILVLAPALAAADEFDLRSALARVQDRYNNMKTMQLDFNQTLTYLSQPKASRSENGTLYLKRPGRMRWEYAVPAKKLFVSDGKDAYFYSPSMNRAEKSRLKETDDVRAPLAFLIGKLDFDRDFREYRTSEENGRRWITAMPKSAKAPYKEVRFLLSPDSRIVELRVVGHDQSVMDYSFRNEKVNPSLSDGLFQFQAPAGVELVDLTDK